MPTVCFITDGMGSVSSCLILADFAYFIYRRQQEAETKIIEEESAKRVEEAIRKKVHDALHSEEFKKEVELKIQEGRKKIIDDIAAQLEREKEEALAEARRKEVNTVIILQSLVLYTTGLYGRVSIRGYFTEGCCQFLPSVYLNIESHSTLMRASAITWNTFTT